MCQWPALDPKPLPDALPDDLSTHRHCFGSQGSSSSVVIFTATLPEPAAHANVTGTFSSGLTANTHYKMYMIAV